MAQQKLVKADTAGEDAQFVREIREKMLNLSQPVMAKLLGFNEMTIYRWESGVTPMKRDAWLAIIGMLAIDGQDFKPVLDYMEATSPIKTAESATINVFDGPPPDDE